MSTADESRRLSSESALEIAGGGNGLVMQFLPWLVVGLMLAAIGVIWFVLYPAGRLPKWQLWILTIVAITVCFALLGGVYYAFQWGYVAAFAVTGILAGVVGATWAEWPSLKRRFRQRTQHLDRPPSHGNHRHHGQVELDGGLQHQRRHDLPRDGK